MCSIAGVINCHNREAAAADIVRAMNAAQTHRGPDDTGIFSCPDAVLGHNRLAVIDVSGGHQPMVADNGRVAVVFNGEIYNYRQLREELIERGHTFRTKSDTEVLIHLYECCGAGFINRLDGMFALAIYDTAERRLLLARDRLGQKPLLYFNCGDTLVFASEFSGLRAHLEFPGEIDLRSLSNFLSLQYIPQPDTGFARVRKLPPGHLLEMRLDNCQISIRCYWRPDYSVKNRELTLDVAASQLRKLLTAAVQKRLETEVPLGTFLSGGVDSCVISGIAARELYPRPCDAFTAVFPNSIYDERENAAENAAIINRVSGGNLRHYEREIDPEDFPLVKFLAEHFGEPYGDASSLPFFLLSRFARERITVALSGDGADEIFAGYERYQAMSYAEKVYCLPRSLRRMIFGTLYSLLPDHGERSKCGRLRRLFRLFGDHEKLGYFNLLNRCPDSMKAELFGPALAETLQEPSSSCFTGLEWELLSPNKVEKLEELDLRTYLPGDILPKADISSMACALELRNPFLDREVVEFAARLPQQLKLCGDRRKLVLCAAFPEFAVPQVVRRAKRGFGVPVADWLRGGWRTEAEGVLFSGSRLLEQGYIREEPLRRYWKLHLSGRDFSYLFWNLINLEYFLRSL